MATRQTSIVTEYSWTCRSCGNQGTTWTYRHRAEFRAQAHADYCFRGGNTTIVSKHDQ